MFEFKKGITGSGLTDPSEAIPSFKPVEFMPSLAFKIAVSYGGAVRSISPANVPS